MLSLRTSAPYLVSEVCHFSLHAGKKLDSGLPDRRTNRGKGDGQETSTRNRVLMLGLVRELALYRAEVLRARGFDVTVCTSEEEAVRLIRSHDFDVAVLSYTLPDSTVRELADRIREHCPECPVIAIANTKLPDRAVKPDQTVLADRGPAALIQALRKVLRQH